ncbi:hypothetical protein ACIGZJ_36850, partial [Kitasatospora sp. NPDC052868]|uniref:hypothetical protein n=1 Tax=Kitasatospora sp. NPDC052868 TaxID=3364060 RepID=UPI0037C79667
MLRSGPVVRELSFDQYRNASTKPAPTAKAPSHTEVEDSDAGRPASQAPSFLPMPERMRQKSDSEGEADDDWDSDSDGEEPAAPVVQAPATQTSATQTPVTQAPATRPQPFLPMPERMRQKSDSEGEADDDWDSDSGGEGPSAPVVRTPATQTVQLPQIATLNIGAQTQPSESSSPVDEPELPDLPELVHEPPITGSFTADELWRDGDRLPAFVLYDGVEGMVWDDGLEGEPSDAQLDRMAAVYNRAAEQAALRLELIVARARQVVADGGDRLAAAQTLLDTHQVLSADGWTPAYISEFLRQQMLFRDSAVPRKFPRELVAWPVGAAYFLVDPTNPPALGADVVQGGSLVGPDGASMAFYDWLDTAAVGGNRQYLYNWGVAQSGTSASRESLEAKVLLAHFRNPNRRHIGDEYFWLNGFEHRLKMTPGFHMEIGRRDVFGFTYQPGYLRSVAAQHMFTYELLRTVPMPRVNRDAGTIDLIRLEQRSVLRELPEPYDPGDSGTNHQQIKIHRGAAESYSLLNPYKEVVGGDFWLTMQTVPIQRVFGTHLQTRMDEVEGETSLYLGEDEFLTMVTDRQVECWGEGQPVVTEQELQTYRDTIAAQQAAAEAEAEAAENGNGNGNGNGNAEEGAAPWSESQAPPSDSDDDWGTGSAPASPVRTTLQYVPQGSVTGGSDADAQEAHSEPSSPVLAPLVLDLPPFVAEPLPAGSFRADELWREGDHLSSLTLLNGVEALVWDDLLSGLAEGHVVDGMAMVHDHVADGIARRLAQIVERAMQEADGNAAARRLVDTYELLSADGWSPVYISEFLYLQMSMRADGVFADLPELLVERPPAFDNGVEVTRRSLVAPGGGLVEGGPLRGAGGVSDTFYTWLDRQPGTSDFIDGWGAQQAGSSWKAHPALAKLLYAHFRSEGNLESTYYWGFSDLSGVLQNITDVRGGPHYVNYGPTDLRALVAQHVFTYELLTTVELPNVDRQNGTVRLIRLENRRHVDDDNPGLPNPLTHPVPVTGPAPGSGIVLELRRGAAESFSLLVPYKDPQDPHANGGPFYVTVQDIPIQRVFGTHLQSRPATLDESLYHGEDEFLVMSAGIPAVYWGTTVPRTPAEQETAALAEQLAAQGLGDGQNPPLAPPLVAGPVGGPVPVVEPGPVVVGAGLLPAQA